MNMTVAERFKPSGKAVVYRNGEPPFTIRIWPDTRLGRLLAGLEAISLRRRRKI